MEKTRFILILIVLPVFFLLNCSKLKNSVIGIDNSCKAAECHLSTVLKKSSPATGKHIQHLAYGFPCEKCHNNYLDKNTHKNGIYDADNGTAIVFFDQFNPSASWNDPITTCENLSCHGDADWNGSATFTCTTCHASGNTTGAPDPVTTNGSGTEGKHVKHVSDMNFLCEECHYDYKSKSTHLNGELDTDNSSIIITYFDSTNPLGSWVGDTGPNTGSCSTLNCHGSDIPDWYGTAGWTLPPCSDCHKNSIGTRRQIFDSNGDGSGVGGDFNKESHHVIDYDNRNTQIIQTSDCIVCHNMDNHMSGTVRLNDKDNPGLAIVYDTGNVSGLEAFCLSCHDSNGANGDMDPFGNGTGGIPNTLGVVPNSAGSAIKDNWNKTYGHRDEGLTCMGSGLPGTGCHGNSGQINAHGSGNYGLLTGNMNFKIQAQDAYNESDYELCFSCHGNYTGIRKEDTLGVLAGGNYDYDLSITPPSMHGSPVTISFGVPPYYNSGIQTRFIDTDGNQHGGGGGGSKYQLHWYHISMKVPNSGATVVDAWLYRGQGNQSSCAGCHSSGSTITTGSKATCISCHNVHGSNTTFGFLYDEFDMTHDAGETTGTMGLPKADLVNSPFYCGVQTCHGGSIDTNYIYSPTGE